MAPLSFTLIFLAICVSTGLAHDGESHPAITAPAVAPAPSPISSSTVPKASFTSLNATAAAVICPELLFFLAAVEAAQLKEFMSSPPTALTILAPSNDAFTKAASLLGGNTSSFLSSPQLGGILMYHMLHTTVTPLGNGARVPSLYHDLPVSVITSNNSLKFLGGSGTNATAFFHIPTLKGDVYVIDNVLDRRQLLPPGTPGSAAATSASLSQALQTLIQLPQAEADAAKLRGGANAPELAVAG